MKRIACLILSTVLVLSLFAGCSGNNPASTNISSPAAAFEPAPKTSEPAASAESGAKEADTHIITDLKGREVELPVNPTRIVNTWPSSNSGMIIIGAGPLLVGTQRTMTDNEWAKLLYPDIVNVPTNIENTEDLLKFDADVVIATEAKEEWVTAGLPVVALQYSNYDNMKAAMAVLGDILGGEYKEKCLRWNEYVDENISFVAERLKDIPDEERPVVHYVAANSNEGPASTGGKDSIFEAWTIAGGGRFAGAMTGATGTQGNISEEELLAMNPDIIIVGGLAQAEVYGELLANETWADVNALKNGQVYCSPIGVFPWCRFGMESAMQIIWTARIVHPDVFEDIDMHQIIYDFYNDFSGVELTEKQIDNMLAGLPPNA